MSNETTPQIIISKVQKANSELSAIVQKNRSIEMGLATSIAANYVPILEEIYKLEAELLTLDKKKESHNKRAHEIHTRLSTLAADADRQKKKDKDHYLVITKYIDSLYKVSESAARVAQITSNDIRNHLKDELQKLRVNRLNLIRPYNDGVEHFKVEEMSQEAFDRFLEATKIAFDKREEQRLAFEAKKKSIAGAFASQKPNPPLNLEDYTPNVFVPNSIQTPVVTSRPLLDEQIQVIQQQQIENHRVIVPSFIIPKAKRPVKILFYDLETTGVYYFKNSIHQIGGILDIDGSTVTEFDISFKPHPNSEINQDALDACKLTLEQLNARPKTWASAYIELNKIVDAYVDKYDKQDKIFLCGYNNARFDDNFLRKFYMDNGDKFFGSRFYDDALDVRVLAANALKSCRHEMTDFKLKTLAAYLGITVDESKLHDAKYDIALTREIYYKIQ